MVLAAAGGARRPRECEASFTLGAQRETSFTLGARGVALDVPARVGRPSSVAPDRDKEGWQAVVPIVWPLARGLRRK